MDDPVSSPSRPAGRRAGVSPVTACLVLTLLIALYLTVRLTPPYVRNYQFEEAIRDEAAQAHVMSDAELRQAILVKAQEIGLEPYLEADDIGIERDAAGRRISVWVDYEVPVELIGGKTVTLQFTPEVDRKIRTQ